MAAIIFFLALSIRLFMFAEAVSTPLVSPHASQFTDMSVYHRWATLIAGGDWLGGELSHPMMRWHEEVARDYFQRRPDKLAELQKESARAGRSPESLIWLEWTGGAAWFHQEPLYYYFAALVYGIWKAEPTSVMAIQLVFGAASASLVFLITLRLFGFPAGIFAAALALLDGSLIWNDILLMRTTMTVFLALLAVHLSLIAQERPTPKWAVLAGMVYGAGALIQAYFMMGCFFFLAWTLVGGRRPWRERVNPAAWLGLGLLIALAPLIARNYAVGAPLLGLSAKRAYLLIIANAPDLDPFHPFNIGTPWVGKIMAVANGDAAATMWALIGARGGLYNYVGFEILKLVAALAPFPMSDNGVTYTYYHHHLAALRLAPVHWVLIAPLAIAGAFVCAGGIGRAVPLYLMILTLFSPLILVFTLARYRVPLEAMLIPLAGLALARIIDILGAKKGAAAIACGAALYLALFSPAGGPPGYADYSFAGMNYFRPKIITERDAGRHEAAAGVFDEWFRFEKDFGIREGGVRPRQARVAHWFVGLLAEQAEALRRAGKPEEAGKRMERAERIRAELAAKGMAPPPERVQLPA